MDPTNNSSSFLKLIHDDDPIFVQPPYSESVKIVDGDKLWIIRLKKTGLGPVLGDGFTKVVRDTGLNKLTIFCSRLSDHTHSLFQSLNHVFTITLLSPK
ncbi:hypothetical protein HanPI659440_Chr05g0188161 [Helianthus annuus]|nr:hypothetical protein HanPI659440_Chr05g0188161 [Helianthus annuus]